MRQHVSNVGVVSVFVILAVGPSRAAENNRVDRPRVGPSGWSSSPPSMSPAPTAPSRAAAAGVDVSLGGTNEVTIAVNPLDSQNLAISSLFQYEVSSDGGQTWTAPQLNQLIGGYSRDGDPTLTYDGSGRLFYAYQGRHPSSGGADEFIAELHPTTGAYLAGPFMVSLSGPAGAYNDKPWLAADQSTAGPFAGRLYMVWAEFSGNVRTMFSRSNDHGATWSTPQAISSFADGFPWPAHVAVAPNGDVYVSYHSQTGFFCNPDGTSGRIVFLRSTDGGVTFPQRTFAYAPGDADITYNVQDCGDGVIPNTDFWMQGSGQGWILPDPLSPGTVYVVANDDPDDVHASGDEGNVYIVRSDDSGMTWSTPSRVDHGPGTSLQVYPTAAIDQSTGCIAVMWYDTRAEAVNSNGNYLLDVFYSISSDGGASFGPDVQLNDVPFDPDKNAPTRFSGPPPTRRIGEYIGVALAGTSGIADLYGVWTGNAFFSQQAITDSQVAACVFVAVCGDGTIQFGEECDDNNLDDGDGCSSTCQIEIVPPGNIVWDSVAGSPARATRSLSISMSTAVTATGGNGTAAIQVRLMDLQNPNPANPPCCPPQNFGAYESAICTAPGEGNACARWVGPPVTVQESQDNLALGTYVASRLQCAPYYTDWTTLGPITMVGAELMPSSTYELTAYGSSCKGAEGACTNVSPAVQALTRRSGDIASPYAPSGTQPDPQDVVAALNKFKNQSGAPGKAIAQIQPNLIELNVDVGALDIVATIDAFKGVAYPYSGPCPCPSTVICGAAPCGTCSGGGLCVRTCSAGTNAGLPCLNDTHCPASTCPSAGFCRDRCGRCRD